MAQKQNASLARELSYYEANKSEWLKSHAEEFVLISGQSVAGFFPSYESALKAGLKKFGVAEQFLIKQVLEYEPVFVVY